MTVAVLGVTTARIGFLAHVFSANRAIIALAASGADSKAHLYHLLGFLALKVDGPIPLELQLLQHAQNALQGHMDLMLLQHLLMTARPVLQVNSLSLMESLHVKFVLRALGHRQ